MNILKLILVTFLMGVAGYTFMAFGMLFGFIVVLEVWGWF